MASASSPPVIMLATAHASLAAFSGYSRLTEYVPNAERLDTVRRDPKTQPALTFARLGRRLALSRWYYGSSAALELKAWRRVARGFRGVVHSLWSDQNLGYLDLMLPRHLPLCATFHGCPADLPKIIRYPGRLKRLAAVVLMSDCQRPYFRQHGVLEERLHTILHGVDTAYFTPAPAVATVPFTVVCAGSYQRNFPLLREVCELLRADPHIRIQVIAPPAQQERFSNLPNVTFHTGLSDAELLARYQGAHCLLHTTEQTTANNVLLEAMACGKPSVAERMGGMPEYVTADSAILTEPGHALALAEAVRSLARDLPRTQQMGVAARHRAEELSWAKVGERTAALYRTLLPA